MLTLLTEPSALDGEPDSDITGYTGPEKRYWVNRLGIVFRYQKHFPALTSDRHNQQKHTRKPPHNPSPSQLKCQNWQLRKG